MRALQCFVGMATYYSKYIKNFSALCKPLYAKINDFSDWVDYEIEFFENIKRNINDAVLVLPNPGEELS